MDTFALQSPGRSLDLRLVSEIEPVIGSGNANEFAERATDRLGPELLRRTDRPEEWRPLQGCARRPCGDPESSGSSGGRSARVEEREEFMIPFARRFPEDLFQFLE
jgi:hypothetical protein